MVALRIAPYLRRTQVSAIVCLALVAFASGCSTSVRIGGSNERVLFSFPPDTPLSKVVFSADGSRSALCVASPQGWRVVDSGGEPGKQWDDIQNLAISENGSAVVYVGVRAGKETVVVNGFECPPAEHVGPPTLSPDGRKVVYISKEQEGSRVVAVKDGQVQSSALFARAGWATYHGAMDSPAFLAQKEDGWHMVTETWSSPPFPVASSLRGSSDGMVFLFLVRSEGKVRLARYEAGKLDLSDPHDSIDATMIQFAAGRHDYVWSCTDQGVTVWRWNSEQLKGAEVIRPPVLFDEAGAILAYIQELSDGGERVVCRGVSCPSFPNVFQLTGVRGGSDCAYVVDWEPGTGIVAFDQVKRTEFESIRSPLAIAEPRILAFSAFKNHQAFTVINDQVFGPYAWVGPAQFNAQTSSVEFGAVRDNVHRWVTVFLE